MYVCYTIICIKGQSAVPFPAASPLPEPFIAVVGKGSSSGEARGHHTTKNNSVNGGGTAWVRREPYKIRTLRFRHVFTHLNGALLFTLLFIPMRGGCAVYVLYLPP